MIKQIKLMPDFGCWPLWEYEDRDLVDNPHPSELPLNQETVKRLLQWQQTYEGIMNWDDPHSAGFASEAERVAFEEEGISLWQQLQKELGNDWEVSYFSELQGKVLKTPAELLSRQPGKTHLNSSTSRKPKRKAMKRRTILRVPKTALSRQLRMQTP